MYFTQAMLISSLMIRVRILLIDGENILTIRKDIKKAIRKVTIISRINIETPGLLVLGKYIIKA
jgi:hypothetical protein